MGRTSIFEKIIGLNPNMKTIGNKDLID